MRKFWLTTINLITWTLFAMAVFLLARQTYFAVQGIQPNYSGPEGAFLVAAMVTTTWVVMLARLVLGMDKTAVDWFISASLFLLGMLVDVVVALAVVFEFQFPIHFALLVIVAHVIAHGIQWLVVAAGDAVKRFRSGTLSPEQELEQLRRQNALLEQQQKITSQYAVQHQPTTNNVASHHVTFDDEKEQQVTSLGADWRSGQLFQRRDVEEKLRIDNPHQARKVIEYAIQSGYAANEERRGYYIWLREDQPEASLNGHKEAVLT